MNPSCSVKILFLHHASMLGGAELSLVDLVTNLSNNISPVCAIPDGPLPAAFLSHGITVSIVPMSPIVKSVNPAYWVKTGFNFLKVVFKLIGICRREKVEVIHANSLTAGIYAAPVSFLCKIPFIWHERDLARHPFLTPLVAKFAKRIIAISDTVAENLKIQLGETSKIQVIYNGVDIERFRPADADSSRGFPGLPTGKKTVLMAAQFVRWKGHNDFIIMASLVRQQIPDAVFVLAGNTKNKGQQKYIRELECLIAEKGLQDQFVWTGFVEDMPHLLQNMDCVVLPSIREPFGRIVVEAMAAGKPVVAVNGGAMPEIIEDGVSGFLIKPGDCKSMAETVCRLLQDSEVAEDIGINGRLRISQKFTIQRTVREFEQLVRDI